MPRKKSFCTVSERREINDEFLKKINEKDFIRSSRSIAYILDSHYMINDSGVVFNLNSGRIVTGSLDRDGYRVIGLKINKSTKQFKMHRLVLLYFGKPCSILKCEVNHINGVKDDNSIENLEWCSRLENMQHAVRTGLKASPFGPRKTVRKFKEIILKPKESPSAEALLASEEDKVNTEKLRIEMSEEESRVRAEIISSYQNGESIYSLCVRFGIKGSIVAKLVSKTKMINRKKRPEFAHNLLTPRTVYGK